MLLLDNKDRPPPRARDRCEGDPGRRDRGDVLAGRDRVHVERGELHAAQHRRYWSAGNLYNTFRNYFEINIVFFR